MYSYAYFHKTIHVYSLNYFPLFITHFLSFVNFRSSLLCLLKLCYKLQIFSTILARSCYNIFSQRSLFDFNGIKSVFPFKYMVHHILICFKKKKKNFVLRVCTIFLFFIYLGSFWLFLHHYQCFNYYTFIVQQAISQKACKIFL